MVKKNIVNESWETSQEKVYNFKPIYEDMEDSRAWNALSGNAIKLYMKLKRQLQRRVYKKSIATSNATDISMPRSIYQEIMSISAFERSMDELIDLGFIKTMNNRYDTRESNIYGFSDMWKRWGASSFKVEPKHRRTLAQQQKALNDSFYGSYAWPAWEKKQLEREAKRHQKIRNDVRNPDMSCTESRTSNGIEEKRHVRNP